VLRHFDKRQLSGEGEEAVEEVYRKLAEIEKHPGDIRRMRDY
jgi:hypothetical protein